MRIVFMRHARAQSQVDSTRIAGRSHGAPLTEDGRRHADKLAWEAQDLRFSSLHVSSCRRTLETAAPLADALALTAQPTDLLVERSHGAFEGRLKSEVYTDEVVAEIHADQWRWSPPGGETLEEVAARVHQWVTTLDHSAQLPVLAVSHLMVMWSVFGLCTGCDHRILPKLKVANGAVIEVEARDGELLLQRWNAPLADTTT